MIKLDNQGSTDGLEDLPPLNVKNRVQIQHDKHKHNFEANLYVTITDYGK